MYRDFISLFCKAGEGAQAQGRGEILFSEFWNSHPRRKVAPTLGANPFKRTTLLFCSLFNIVKQVQLKLNCCENQPADSYDS